MIGFPLSSPLLAVLAELRAILRGRAPDRRQRVEPVDVERRRGERRAVPPDQLESRLTRIDSQMPALNRTRADQLS